MNWALKSQIMKVAVANNIFELEDLVDMMLGTALFLVDVE